MKNIYWPNDLYNVHMYKYEQILESEFEFWKRK